MNKKLENIILVSSLVVGFFLVGIGLYRDKKAPDGIGCVENTIIKGVGLASAAIGYGLALRRFVDYDTNRDCPR